MMGGDRVYLTHPVVGTDCSLPCSSGRERAILCNGKIRLALRFRLGGNRIPGRTKAIPSGQRIRRPAHALCNGSQQWRGSHFGSIDEV